MTRSRAIRDRVPRGQLAALPAALPVAPSLLGDADRDRFVAVLRKHYAAGRLSLDELGHRVGIVLATGYANEAAAVTADLPPGGRQLDLRGPQVGIGNQRSLVAGERADVGGDHPLASRDSTSTPEADRSLSKRVISWKPSAACRRSEAVLSAPAT